MESNYESVYSHIPDDEARDIFDPNKIAIHSCLRPEDDLVSNYGPVHRKHVSFSNYFTIIEIESNELDDHYMNLPTPVHLPVPRKSELYRLPVTNTTKMLGQRATQNYPPQFNASEIWGYENIFSDPYSAWDLDPQQPLSLNNGAQEDLMVAKYRDACLCEPSLRPVMFPILKRKGGPRKTNQLVRFAMLQKNFFCNNTVSETWVSFDPLPDCWKPSYMDNTPPYWLNCSLL